MHEISTDMCGYALRSRAAEADACKVEHACEDSARRGRQRSCFWFQAKGTMCRLTAGWMIIYLLVVRVGVGGLGPNGAAGFSGHGIVTGISDVQTPIFTGRLGGGGHPEQREHGHRWGETGCGIGIPGNDSCDGGGSGNLRKQTTNKQTDSRMRAATKNWLFRRKLQARHARQAQHPHNIH